MSEEIIGQEELLKKLVAIAAEEDAALKMAGDAAGLVVVNRWKTRIRNTAYRTGTYMRSIHAETAIVAAHAAEVTIGTDITDPPYPFFLEYGTVHMTARPTMTPAFEESKEPAIAEAGAVFRKILEAHLL